MMMVVGNVMVMTENVMMMIALNMMMMAGSVMMIVGNVMMMAGNMMVVARNMMMAVIKCDVHFCPCKTAHIFSADAVIICYAPLLSVIHHYYFLFQVYLCDFFLFQPLSFA